MNGDAGRPPLRAVVFDLDGVLLDSEAINVASVEYALRRFGSAAPDGVARLVVGRHPRDYVPEIAATVGLPAERIPEFVRIQDAWYRAEWSAAIRLVDGADDVVEALSTRGVPMAVATSAGRDQARRSLERFGLWERFDAVVARDDVTSPKPDPEPYARAVSALGVAPSGAAAIEDSGPGLRSAGAAGLVTFAYVPRPESEPPGESAHVLRRLSDLLPWFPSRAS